ncbi:hypothetical protein [Flectobacillus roseus]|uniref:hypothetical protein n=1 Tax=Flectobacillus roseus TaxID=502259 RepID=UPI0024B7D976|nr:hypothetical protein [Flectobacillus roseus]MDI9870580.1 hypothetical protein [Flectobacillus roseus]
MSRKKINTRYLEALICLNNTKELSEVEQRIQLCILLKEVSLENIDFVIVHSNIFAPFQHIFSKIMKFQKSDETSPFEVIIIDKKEVLKKYNQSGHIQITGIHSLAEKIQKRQIIYLTCKKNTHYKRELTVGKDYMITDVIFSETENICVVSDYGQPIEVPISYFE